MAVFNREIPYEEFVGEAPARSGRTLSAPRLRVPKLPNPLLVDIHHSAISGLDMQTPVPNEPRPPKYIRLSLGINKRSLTALARLAVTELGLIS
jgi:hypothetical protein